MNETATHMPRCNTACRSGDHLLLDGIGYPHIHRTDVRGECGECAAPTTRRETEPETDQHKEQQMTTETSSDGADR